LPVLLSFTKGQVHQSVLTVFIVRNPYLHCVEKKTVNARMT